VRKVAIIVLQPLHLYIYIYIYVSHILTLCPLIKLTEFFSKLLPSIPVKCNITLSSGNEKNEESHTYAGGTKEETKRHNNGVYPITLLA
jgi:hypothetical protein